MYKLQFAVNAVILIQKNNGSSNPVNKLCKISECIRLAQNS